jgi:murein L,D-transpeptidase YcbB/YkuD
MSNLDGVNDQANASYAPAVCEVYIKDYIRVGANTNAPQDVKNLQAFLNTTQGEHLVVDGAYKDVDVAAVKRFQTRYIETLKFWGLTEATGQVLQTTINKINTLQCERNQKLTCPYFGGYQKLGAANPEVVKIKKFLNNTQGESLDTSSNKFDNALFEAVKRFQSKYLGTALRPWGITTATGFWYQSTRKTAHDVIGCFEAVRLDNGVVLR